jgi:hypothetical protein
MEQLAQVGLGGATVVLCCAAARFGTSSTVAGKVENNSCGRGTGVSGVGGGADVRVHGPHGKPMTKVEAQAALKAAHPDLGCSSSTEEEELTAEEQRYWDKVDEVLTEFQLSKCDVPPCKPLFSLPTKIATLVDLEWWRQENGSKKWELTGEKANRWSGFASGFFTRWMGGAVRQCSTNGNRAAQRSFRGCGRVHFGEDSAVPSVLNR